MAENDTIQNNESTLLEIENSEALSLKTLVEKQEKQLFYSRIAGISCALMAVILLIVCVILVPKVLNTLNQVNSLVADTNTTVKDMQNTIAQADIMIEEITGAAGEISTAAGGINTLVDENSGVLSDSVAKMNAIDFEGLNKAIQDLRDVVEPMANFMNKFR